MYSDAELEAAVKAGVLSAPTAAAFRDFVAASHAAPGADEEHFRLLTGFNDIFVSIATTLILVAIGWLAGRIAPWLAGAAIAATSWGLAEYFTRRRRMALPSILLLLTFVGGVFGALIGLAATITNLSHANQTQPLIAALCAAGAATAAYAHWRRFMVPITVAAGTGAAFATLLLILVAAFPSAGGLFRFCAFLAGLAMFAIAMWWDASDRARTTRRADVAFWLHLAAAPLIVHPAFSQLGLLGHGTPAAANAIIAVLLYLALALVALAADRRALLVSALAYVLYAITALLQGAGSVNTGLALAALVIGSGLLLLSAFWHTARAFALNLLPPALRENLPAV